MVISTKEKNEMGKVEESWNFRWRLRGTEKLRDSSKVSRKWKSWDLNPDGSRTCASNHMQRWLNLSVFQTQLGAYWKCRFQGPAQVLQETWESALVVFLRQVVQGLISEKCWVWCQEEGRPWESRVASGVLPLCCRWQTVSWSISYLRDPLPTFFRKTITNELQSIRLIWRNHYDASVTT